MPDMTKQTDTPAGLSGIVNIIYLNRDNCEITEKNGFIGLKAVVDKPDGWTAPEEKKDEKPSDKPDEKDGKKEEEAREKGGRGASLENGKLERRRSAYSSRAFPFDMPLEYISVLDRDKKEIGFIRCSTTSTSRREVHARARGKYYTPKIKKIYSVKERYGFSYWKTECEFGEKSFTLQDTFRSIIRSHLADGTERVFILDVDGNRYEIENVEALDRQSYKKIELYL
ncbi:MAG: DUF1854 domain-containing protein [Eubacteriales bacterium]